MLKNPFYNRLGDALKKVRAAHVLTQADLASKAHLSIPTVRNLERGRGNLTSWQLVLACLNVEMAGHNLPPGHAIGRQIALLRKRKGIGQRALASVVGITQPTLVYLERHSKGRLDVLERVLTILGSGAHLAPKGSTKPFYTHAGNSSGHDGWRTPKELLTRLYRVVGTFDLDPCSPTQNRRTAPVRAKMYYTTEDDGLLLPWFGNVFMNPPYGRPLRRWIAKAKAEVGNGNAKMVMALIPARTDTAYWHEDIANSAQVFFLRGRLRFSDAARAAPFPSSLAVWGGDARSILALKEALPDAWLYQGMISAE